MEKNWLVEGINENDLHFELQLLKEPKNEDVWNQYIDHKYQELVEASPGDADHHVLNSLKGALLKLYYRKYHIFDTFNSWCDFIELYIKFLNHLKAEELTSELMKIIRVFEVAAVTYAHNVEFWRKYIEFLFKYDRFIGLDYILRVCETSLREVDKMQHIQIWGLLFKYIKDPGFHIYYNLFTYISNCYKFDVNIPVIKEGSIPDIDATFKGLIKTLTSIEDLAKFDRVFNRICEPQLLLKVSDSELELHRKYLDAIINLSLKQQDGNEYNQKIETTYNKIVQKFPDQRGVFTVKYAKYLIKSNLFEDAMLIAKKTLDSTLTIKDFTLSFNFLTDALEKKVTELSEHEDDPKLKEYLNELESLLNNRELLMNDVKLRQNRNSPITWLERLSIFEKIGRQDQLFVCYSKAVLEIDPRKILNDEKLDMPQIWINYSKLYASNGDIETCRKLFETATKYPWTDVSQLEKIWIEWIRFEINNNNAEHAKFICSKAISIPEQITSGKVDFEDDDLSVQMKLFKSLKLRSLYIDLVANFETIDDVCKAYEDCIELQVADERLIVHYCVYLLIHNRFEQGYYVFERNLNGLNGDVQCQLYDVFMERLLKDWNNLAMGKEKVREIFENGLRTFTDMGNYESLRDTYIRYSEFERKYGSQTRSLRILREGILTMDTHGDRFKLYRVLIQNTMKLLGIEATADVIKDALEELSVNLPGYTTELVKELIDIEVLLGHTERARKVLEYAAQEIMEFGKTKTAKSDIWELFKTFEIKNGSESTYKEMLRRKRYLENKYGSSRDAGDELNKPKYSSTNTEVAKQLNDRVGFVPSSSSSKLETEAALPKKTTVQNNDAIELDMD